jgi:nitrogen-specific signal transduction histidine kinase
LIVDIATELDVAKGLPHGLGDEQRLTQVLLNLVGNASSSRTKERFASWPSRTWRPSAGRACGSATVWKVS